MATYKLVSSNGEVNARLILDLFSACFPDSDPDLFVCFPDSDPCFGRVLGFRKCSWTVSPNQIMFFVCFPDSDPGVGPVS